MRTREALADAITHIKRRDRLTDEELGEGFGMSPDRARDYRAADASMTAEAWHRGVKAFGPDFGDAGLALIGYRLQRINGSSLPITSAPKVLTAILGGLLDLLETHGEDIPDAALRRFSVEIGDLGLIADDLRNRARRMG